MPKRERTKLRTKVPRTLLRLLAKQPKKKVLEKMLKPKSKKLWTTFTCQICQKCLNCTNPHS